MKYNANNTIWLKATSKKCNDQKAALVFQLAPITPLARPSGAYLTAGPSGARWACPCGPRLRTEPAPGCLRARAGAAPGAPAGPSPPRGSGWGSGSAGPAPGGGSVRCPSRCRWSRPGSWSAGRAPWACSCPPPCARTWAGRRSQGGGAGSVGFSWTHSLAAVPSRTALLLRLGTAALWSEPLDTVGDYLFLLMVIGIKGLSLLRNTFFILNSLTGFLPKIILLGYASMLHRPSSVWPYSATRTLLTRRSWRERPYRTTPLTETF